MNVKSLRVLNNLEAMAGSTKVKKINLVFQSLDINVMKTKNMHGILWRVFKFYGIDITDDACYSPWLKSGLKIYPILMLLTQIYITYGSMASLDSSSYLLSSIISSMLWCILYSKKRTIQGLIANLRKLKLSHNTNSKRSEYIINVLVVLTILVPLLCAVICVSMLKGSNLKYKRYYSFFTELDDSSYSTFFVRFMVALLNLLHFISFPSIASILCSVLYYNYSECLEYFRTNINSDKDKDINVVVSLLKSHRRLFELGHQLENALSTTCFFILCSHILSMYLSLISVFLSPSSVYSSAFWELVPSMTVVPLNVFFLCASAGRVYNEMDEQRNSLQLWCDEMMTNPRVDWKTVELVKNMKEKKFPGISGAGLVKLTPDFILSLFSSLLTYGLLVYNIGVA